MSTETLGIHQTKIRSVSYFSTGRNNLLFTWGEWLFRKAYPGRCRFERAELQRCDVAAVPRDHMHIHKLSVRGNHEKGHNGPRKSSNQQTTPSKKRRPGARILSPPRQVSKASLQRVKSEHSWTFVTISYTTRYVHPGKARQDPADRRKSY